MGLVPTLQDNIKKNSTDITSYSYWLGGANTKNAALAQFDPLRTGYGRIFILQMPKFVKHLLPDETEKFKHLLEYANTGIDGIAGYTVDFGQMTGGYVGTSVDIPTNAKDDTNSVNIKLYEVSGSLVRTYLDFWISGVSDVFAGYSHYHGARKFDSSLVSCQANQTMEAIYVVTDPSGEELEYACLLTNMFPKASPHDHMNYSAGEHNLVDLSIEFTAVKYMSAQINEVGKKLLDKFNVQRNYLQMHSGYDTSDIAKLPDSEIKDWVTEK